LPILLLLLPLACAEGGSSTRRDGASGADGPGASDGPSDVDGEMPPPGAAGPAREIVAGATRLSGGTLVVEAEVGHAFGQGRMSGGSFRIEGAAAVVR
jgi:hypothetical protein